MRMQTGWQHRRQIQKIGTDARDLHQPGKVMAKGGYLPYLMRRPFLQDAVSTIASLMLCVLEDSDRYRSHVKFCIRH